MTMATDGVEIIYDGDCPFCASYTKMLRLREAAGPVRLINAREGGPEVEAVLAAGYDLDRGMVVSHRGQIHYGDAAMLFLAGLTAEGGIFNRVMRILFRSKVLSRVIYPVLVAGRRITLWLLGRKKIADGQKKSSPAE